MTNDITGGDDRECGRYDEPCGSPDCGRCLPVCNVCGEEHETAAHAAAVSHWHDGQLGMVLMPMRPDCWEAK